MRCVRRHPTGQPALPTGTALLLVTLAGCSSEPAQDTKVIFDGQSYTIHAAVRCGIGPDGKLGIAANTERGKKLISVLLTRDYPLVVESVAFRHFDVRGFTNDSNQVWATKADNTYTIVGRMPPGKGETAAHLFKIEVACPQIIEYTPDYRDPNVPKPPRI
jgi:Mycobacterium 19 kDa lipoprotein antigen